MNNRYREEELNEINNEKKDDNNLNEKISKENHEEVDLDNEDELDEEVESNDKHEKPNKKVKKLENKINKLNEEITELENKLKQSNEQYLRTLAEMENFKKRINDERIKERKYASQRLLEKLITNTDIFDKACNMQTNDPNLNNFLIGFQMINNNIKNVLEEEGVKKIKCDGLFDPHYQHAVDTDYDETKEEGAILAVIKDGYMYKDRVLVAAMVKVNKKPEENKVDTKSDLESDNK